VRDLRLGDIIDDWCVKCRRLTNHAIVSLMEAEAAKVRCRSCYSDHNYLKEIAPPSKKELKKLADAALAVNGDAPEIVSEAAGSLGDGVARKSSA
jgi:formate dehydrogenase maturation protein FdhE